MANKRGWRCLSDNERLERILANRKARMDRVDAMPPELRDMVNAYGLSIVDTCIALGVSKPRHIRHLVETILDEFSPTRGSFSRQGIRTDVVAPSPTPRSNTP